MADYQRVTLVYKFRCTDVLFSSPASRAQAPSIRLRHSSRSAAPRQVSVLERQTLRSLGLQSARGAPLRAGGGCSLVPLVPRAACCAPLPLVGRPVLACSLSGARV